MSLSTREAAAVIGCGQSHVCWLVRQGLLPATRERSDANQTGYRLRIRRVDAERYRDTPQSRGFPRGTRRI